MAEAVNRRGYGDVAMDVPVASGFGRYLIEYLIDHEFDVAHMRYLEQPYGGRVARRYPTRTGELDYVRETPPHEQGLPHAVSFIVKRLFDNQPGVILPVFQNTCYPPNQPTPRRCFALGQAIAAAVAEWKEPSSVGGAVRRAAASAPLGGVGDVELGDARRSDAGHELEDGAAGVRPGVPDAGGDRGRLGVRALAVVSLSQLGSRESHRSPIRIELGPQPALDGGPPERDGGRSTDLADHRRADVTTPGARGHPVNA